MRIRNNLLKLSSKSQRAKKNTVEQNDDLQHAEEKTGQKPLSQKILRFRKSERHLHWAIAIPFMTCYITALILILYYNGNAIRPYRDAFSWGHRISGVCLFVLPMLAILKSRKDLRVYFYNIKQAWVWTFNDIKWLAMMGLAAISKKFKLPDQGKFNAAEKINFMMLMSTYPLYILTGLLIWMTNGALLAWLIHFAMALFATPLLVGHKFMAMVNPNTKIGLPGMLNGYVDRNWAKHHYKKWYWEHFGSDHNTVENSENNVPSMEKKLPLIGQVEGESLRPVRVTQEKDEHTTKGAVSV
jgi:formate dehydrogenase subunit gamma